MERRYISEDDFFRIKLKEIEGITWVNYGLHPYPRNDKYVGIIDNRIELYVDDARADYKLP